MSGFYKDTTQKVTVVSREEYEKEKGAQGCMFMAVGVPTVIGGILYVLKIIGPYAGQ